MPEPPLVNSKYDVEIGPGAWRQVGRVPTAAFERIRTELERRGELAALQDQMGIADMPPQTRNHVLLVDAYTITYSVDDSQRVVTLLAIEVRPQEKS